MREAVYILSCDAPGCDNFIKASTEGNVKLARYARSAALREAWDLSNGARCADCREYDKCEMCGRNMRPFDAPKERHPGTVAKGKRGVCTSCRDHPGASLDRAVRRFYKLQRRPVPESVRQA